MAQVVFFCFLASGRVGRVSRDGVAAKRDEVERRQDEVLLWLIKAIFGLLTTKVGLQSACGCMVCMCEWN